MNNPFVSIIVPVYNDPKGIGACVRALLNQTYPPENYEILVVNNASTDDTAKVVESFGVTALSESDIQGSYAARNTGVLHAKGNILAFTDADCLPVSDWLIQGVTALERHEADLLSGHVRFLYSDRRTGAELWDSITNMQIEENIAERNITKTANLFVRKRVFDEIGLFPEELKSGGDVIWTGRATSKGKKLIYHASAEVAHPARRIKELFAKQVRVGKGQPAIWMENGDSALQVAARILRGLIPIRPRTVKRILLSKGMRLQRGDVLRTWAAALGCRISGVLGNVAAILKHSAR